MTKIMNISSKISESTKQSLREKARIHLRNNTSLSMYEKTAIYLSGGLYFNISVVNNIRWSISK
jgi:hypothetical protein